MRNFLLGVAVTLALVAAATVGLVASLGRTASAIAAPGPTPSAAADRPSTVGAGQTWLGDVSLASSDVLTEGGTFRDIEATGKGVTLSTKGIQANSLALEVTLPWADAAAQVGDGITLYAVGSGRAGLARTVSVLGQDLPVKATGTVRAENGLLVLEPESIDLSGPDWVDAAASALVRSLVTIRQPVTGVPNGMRLTHVSVIDTGFRATLTGTNVTITK